MAKRFILSDQSINSYGFVVLTAGGDLKRFNTNPVMLYMHDRKVLLGKWKDIKIENDELTAEAVFNTKNKLANEKAQEVEDGFLNGASIGLLPLEVQPGNLHGFDKTVPVVTKWELLEASICSLPSNGGALALYDKQGNVLDEDKIKELTLTKRTAITMNNLTAIAKALGLSDNATEADITAAIEAQKAATANLQAQAQQDKANQIKSLVDGAIATKRITEGDRDVYTKLATSDYDSTKTVLDKLTPPVKPLDLVDQRGKGTADLTDRSAWTFRDWTKNDPAGLKNLEVQNPAGYEKLVADFRASVNSKR